MLIQMLEGYSYCLFYSHIYGYCNWGKLEQKGSTVAVIRRYASHISVSTLAAGNYSTTVRMSLVLL